MEKNHLTFLRMLAGILRESGNIDVAHFLSHQILDDTDFGDLVSSAYPDTADFPISQEAIRKFLTDAAQHDTQVIDFDNIGVILKHFLFLQGATSF